MEEGEIYPGKAWRPSAEEQWWLPGKGYKPISEDSSSTQHLITPVPQPGRDDRWVSGFRFDPIMDNTADVGLVVEDILDGHTGKWFGSTSPNLLTIQCIGHLAQGLMLGIQLEYLRHHHSL